MFVYVHVVLHRQWPCDGWSPLKEFHQMSIKKIPKTEKNGSTASHSSIVPPNKMEILSLWLYSPLDLGRLFRFFGWIWLRIWTSGGLL
jgi:hypothetical protein